MKTTCEHCGAVFDANAFSDWLLHDKGCPDCGKGPNLVVEVEGVITNREKILRAIRNVLGEEPHTCPNCDGTGRIHEVLGGVIKKSTPCDDCGGTGVLEQPHTCPTCEGYGYVKEVIFQNGELFRASASEFMAWAYLRQPEHNVCDIPCPECNE